MGEGGWAPGVTCIPKLRCPSLSSQLTHTQPAGGKAFVPAADGQIGFQSLATPHRYIQIGFQSPATPHRYIQPLSSR